MESTTCKSCNRVVWVKDVDAEGNCEDCKVPAPHAPTEEEWVDLGRPQ